MSWNFTLVKGAYHIKFPKKGAVCQEYGRALIWYSSRAQELPDDMWLPIFCYCWYITEPSKLVYRRRIWHRVLKQLLYYSTVFLSYLIGRYSDPTPFPAKRPKSLKVLSCDPQGEGRNCVPTGQVGHLRSGQNSRTGCIGLSLDY